MFSQLTRVTSMASGAYYVTHSFTARVVWPRTVLRTKPLSRGGSESGLRADREYVRLVRGDRCDVREFTVQPSVSCHSRQESDGKPLTHGKSLIRSPSLSETQGRDRSSPSPAAWGRRARARSMRCLLLFSHPPSLHTCGHGARTGHVST